MKTRLFLAALAGVALASCVTDKEYDVPAQNENIKIAFDSPVMYDNDTRANYYGEIGNITYGTTTYTYPRDENFQIYAVEHVGDFAGWSAATTAAFNDTPISRDQNLDGWAPKNNGSYYYWPSGKKMSFAACSPADLEQSVSRTYGADGLTITNFKVPAVGQQYDLMFSQRTVNNTSSSMIQGADKYSGVPILFQHALSSIHFSIMNSSGENVVLKQISVYGIHDTATFKENISENNSDYTQYERGTNVDPTWTNTNTVAEITDANPYVAFTGSLTFPASAQYISSILSEDTTNPSINHALLLLPQELSDNAVLKVDYTVNGSDAHKIVKLNSAVDQSDQNITEWEMGTKYTYRLYYSAASASQDKIYFSPSSDSWEDAGVAIIELMNTNN